MRRAHFKLLANTISGITDPEERNRTCIEVGKICADANPRFNWEKWRLACGYTTEQELTKLSGRY